jgi:hypothetical protein
MVTYIYFVKCPNCEDEHFDFFDDAKAFALGCMSQKPIITQTEVCRNNFGECTDSCDLGTVWSWEDAVGTPEEEPATVFSKDDIVADYDPDNDPEFQDDDFFAINSEEDPTSITESNDEERLSSNAKGDYLVRASSGRGYTVFNRNDVAIGGFSGDDDDVAIRRFKVGDITEARKPIPDGMTIEELVEEMEENEDTVECTLCNDLFDKSECRKELNLGWLCRRCADDLTARGEGPVFKEDNYWDFLDEDAEPHDLGNEYDGGYPATQTWVCYFDGVDIGTVEAATEDEALEKMQREYPEYPYGERKHDDCWWVELVVADNLTEASLGDILRNANDEYGTDYTEQGFIDAEGFEDADAFDDIETGIEIYHDAQERKRARREYAINKAKAAKNQAEVNAFDLDFPEV